MCNNHILLLLLISSSLSLLIPEAIAMSKKIISHHTRLCIVYTKNEAHGMYPISHPKKMHIHTPSSALFLTTYQASSLDSSVISPFFPLNQSNSFLKDHIATATPERSRNKTMNIIAIATFCWTIFVKDPDRYIKSGRFWVGEFEGDATLRKRSGIRFVLRVKGLVIRCW